MILFLLGCLSNPSKELDSADTGQQTDSTGNGTAACFSDTNTEAFMVYSTPYDTNGNQSNRWVLRTIDGFQEFEMGRATGGEVQISADGTWGAVAQNDGSIGLFRYQNEMVDVLQSNWKATYEGEELYASNLWLDSMLGHLWLTDGNRYTTGGIYRLDIDCSTGEIGEVHKLLQAEMPWNVVDSPSEHRHYVVAKKVDDEGHHITRIDPYNGELSDGITIYDHDEAIFSAIATDGTHLMVGENNSFSGIPNTVVHLQQTTSGLEILNQLEIEDPVGIAMVGDWALISSGFGNALWQYQMSSQRVNKITPSSTSQLPSTIYARDEAFFVVEYNGVRKLLFDENGYQSDGFILVGEEMEDLLGAVGLFGSW